MGRVPHEGLDPRADIESAEHRTDGSSSVLFQRVAIGFYCDRGRVRVEVDERVTPSAKPLKVRISAGDRIEQFLRAASKSRKFCLAKLCVGNCKAKNNHGSPGTSAEHCLNVGHERTRLFTQHVSPQATSGIVFCFEPVLALLPDLWRRAVKVFHGSPLPFPKGLLTAWAGAILPERQSTVEDADAEWLWFAVHSWRLYRELQQMNVGAVTARLVDNCTLGVGEWGYVP